MRGKAVSGYTDADVCSMAFAHLGESGISSLADNGTKPQRIAALFYENIRRQLLSNPHWNFANYTQVLAQLSGRPVNPDWRYHFALPTDPKLVKAVRVWPQGLSYKIEATRLLSNSPAVTLNYQADVATGSLPDYFVTYLSLVCAIRWCMAITANIKIKNSLVDDLRELAPEIHYTDASSDTTEVLQDMPFIDARF